MKPPFHNPATVLAITLVTHCAMEAPLSSLDQDASHDRFWIDSRDPHALCTQVMEHSSCWGLPDWQNYLSTSELFDSCMHHANQHQAATLVMNTLGGGGIQCLLVSLHPFAQSERSRIDCTPCPPGAPFESTVGIRIGVYSDDAVLNVTEFPDGPVFFPPEQPEWTPGQIFVVSSKDDNTVTVESWSKSIDTTELNMEPPLVVIGIIGIVVVGVAGWAVAALAAVGVLLEYMYTELFNYNAPAMANALQDYLNSL